MGSADRRVAAKGAGDERLAGGLVLGGGVLLYRTIALLAGGASRVLQPWAVALTWLEMAIDVLTIAASARWLVRGSAQHATLALRLGAAATVVHAIRVGIFVLGRTGAWPDFDVRPEARAGHQERWSWTQVVFAATTSVLGIAGAALIWRRRRRHA